MAGDGTEPAPETKRDAGEEGKVPPQEQVEQALRTLIDAVVPREPPAPGPARRGRKPGRQR